MALEIVITATTTILPVYPFEVIVQVTVDEHGIQIIATNNAITCNTLYPTHFIGFKRQYLCA